MVNQPPIQLPRCPYCLGLCQGGTGCPRKRATPTGSKSDG